MAETLRGLSNIFLVKKHLVAEKKKHSENMWTRKKNQSSYGIRDSPADWPRKKGRLALESEITEHSMRHM